MISIVTCEIILMTRKIPRKIIKIYLFIESKDSCYYFIQLLKSN